MNSLHNNRINASEIAEFFLSLDPKREYFIKDKMIKVEGNSVPMAGNLRLNKLLQITQMLYASKEGKYLFPEKFWAFEHGGIIYDIYHRFHFLVNPHRHISFKNLSSDLKIFLTKIFNYFKSYTNKQLEDFVHEDPAWFTNWDDQKKSKEMAQNSEMIKYYQDFVYHIAEKIGL